MEEDNDLSNLLNRKDKNIKFESNDKQGNYTEEVNSI